VLIDINYFTLVVFRCITTSMYSHRCNQISSIIKKLVFKLLQRRDIYAFYMHDLFLTFFERTYVYFNSLFSFLSLNTTFNLIAFFFSYVRFIVIDKNY